MDYLLFIENPIYQQISVVTVLGIGLILFLKDRIRYDVVALSLMLAIILLGVLPANEAFANFGHPAIIIVACMFVISEAFVRSGVVDAIMARIGFLHRHPIIGLSVLVCAVALLSSFINNAGALAIVIPIAVHLAHKSNTPIALFLLPLAFASHLGGFMTLIGTPRNIIISDFREQATGVPFAMFDFLPVGGVIAVLGIVFLVVISWRFIPLRKMNDTASEQSREYTTEVTISPHSKVAEMTILKFEAATKQTIRVRGIYRGDEFIRPTSTLGLMVTDHLILQGDIESLTYYTEHFHLTLTGMRARESHVTNEDDQITTEVVVPPYAKLVSQTWDTIPLQERFGINFIGISRRDNTLVSTLAQTRIWPNDILLLHGRRDSVQETIQSLRLLPIADSDVPLGRTLRAVSTLLIIACAILLATLNIIPLGVVFLATCLVLILFNLISLRQAYDSIDQTVLILLAGMITLGEALQQSGAAESIANYILTYGDLIGPTAMLIVILIASMVLSDFMNTTASAVTMAPIAILMAESLSVSVDPYLMAVAIGASCAFLTPIGHESNAMVMKRGGYTFKDFFRVGLPLEILIAAASIPLILNFWPLY